MKVLTPTVSTWIITMMFAAGFVVSRSDAQTQSDENSDRIMRERIAIIFEETIKSGETRIFDLNGHPITATTFMPPTNEHVEEIRRYGEKAIPVLTGYLNRPTGFEKHLALRFLGSIGGERIIDPLRKVALNDPSASFRSTALLWLSGVRWDLAAPIIRHAAKKDSSAEVRMQAKAILAQHQMGEP